MSYRLPDALLVPEEELAEGGHRSSSAVISWHYSLYQQHVYSG